MPATNQFLEQPSLRVDCTVEGRSVRTQRMRESLALPCRLVVRALHTCPQQGFIYRPLSEYQGRRGALDRKTGGWGSNVHWREGSESIEGYLWGQDSPVI